MHRKLNALQIIFVALVHIFNINDRNFGDDVSVNAAGPGNTDPARVSYDYGIDLTMALFIGVYI